jgi:hypothetical protein
VVEGELLEVEENEVERLDWGEALGRVEGGEVQSSPQY